MWGRGRVQPESTNYLPDLDSLQSGMPSAFHHLFKMGTCPERILCKSFCHRLLLLYMLPQCTSAFSTSLLHTHTHTQFPIFNLALPILLLPPTPIMRKITSDRTLLVFFHPIYIIAVLLLSLFKWKLAPQRKAPRCLSGRMELHSGLYM
jgi:hypothetical protein